MEWEWEGNEGKNGEITAKNSHIPDTPSPKKFHHSMRVCPTYTANSFWLRDVTVFHSVQNASQLNATVSSSVDDKAADRVVRWRDTKPAAVRSATNWSRDCVCTELLETISTNSLWQEINSGNISSMGAGQKREENKILKKTLHD